MLNENKQCNLIIDSCCDLPWEVVEASNVTLFRYPFNMNDGEHFDDMWKSMDAHAFYDRIRKGEVSGTAQIPVLEITEVFEEAAAKGVPTVVLCLSVGLSGTVTTLERLAAETREAHPGFELYIVDTKLASIAEGLLVYEAIRQRDRGLTAKQLAQWAEEARWYVNCLFTIDSLECLRRGGRIPDMAAFAGAKLDIKPLLNFDLDGKLRFAGMARGRKKSLRSLDTAYENEHVDDSSASTVLVASADDKGSAKWVSDHLKRPEGSLPVIECSIGPVIGSHVGPGMVAIAYWGDDRRKKASIADRIANKLGKN